MSAGKVLIIIVALLAVAEIAALVWLLSTVNSYKVFWQDKAKQEGEITYLALGDSAAQGIGATNPMRGYVGLIAQRLEAATGKKVRIVNFSTTGAKINNVIQDQIPMVDDIKADYVTIEIGANDVKDFNETKFSEQFGQLLPLLPDGAYVSNLPLFNSRPSSTAPARKASGIIQELLVDYPKLKFVDLQKQTADNQSIFGFAPDLFHPNNLSYKNWADAFWLKIQSH